MAILTFQPGGILLKYQRNILVFYGPYVGFTHIAKYFF